MEEKPTEQKEKKRSRKRKLARRQAEEIESLYDETKSGLYNIWYNKTMGDYSTWRERRELKLAGKRYRCRPKEDSGKTRARKDAYICLYFARGKCVQGPDCTFLHRIPNEHDEQRIGLAVDIFGRERHRTNRDDMGGVGSFEINNKTLYIGGIKMRGDEDIEQVIRDEFGEFGEIDLINVIKSKSIAFVRYKLRVSAEFAKEAMADQSLGQTEIINVRWANADPNPVAQERDEMNRLLEASVKIQETYQQQYNYDYSLAKGYYPNTDHQYDQSIIDQWKAYYAYYGYYFPSDTTTANGSGSTDLATTESTTSTNTTTTENTTTTTPSSTDKETKDEKKE